MKLNGNSRLCKVHSMFRYHHLKFNRHEKLENLSTPAFLLSPKVIGQKANVAIFNSPIKILQRGCFNGTYLENLDLSSINISEIEAGAFVNTTISGILYINTGYGISTIKSGAFQNMGHSNWLNIGLDGSGSYDVDLYNDVHAENIHAYIFGTQYYDQTTQKWNCFQSVAPKLCSDDKTEVEYYYCADVLQQLLNCTKIKSVRTQISGSLLNSNKVANLGNLEVASSVGQLILSKKDSREGYTITICANISGVGLEIYRI